MKTINKIDDYLVEKINKRIVKSKLQTLDRTIDDFIEYLEGKIDIIDDTMYPVFKRKLEQLLADLTKEHGEFMLALRNIAAALDRGPKVIAMDRGTAKGTSVDQRSVDTEEEEVEKVETKEEKV